MEGLRVRTPQPLQANHMVDMNLSPPECPIIETTARVVWSTEVEPEKFESAPRRFEVGLQFVNLSGPNGEILLQYIDRCVGVSAETGRQQAAGF